MHRLALLILMTLGACAPSIDPAAKASLDQWNAGIQTQPASFADTGVTRKPPNPGQWAEYRTVDADGRLSRNVVKVVGAENGGFWIEHDIQSYNGQSITKALIAMTDWNKPETFEVRRLIQQGPDGQAGELPVFLVKGMAGTLVSMFGTSADRQNVGPAETVTVPAGHFDAHKIVSEGIAMPFIGNTAATQWISNAVPVWNTVLVEHANGTRMELVGFGETGAATAITGPVQSPF